jgi:hypothetical protein
MPPSEPIFNQGHHPDVSCVLDRQIQYYWEIIAK